jgi:TusA-related sulfurtransferase
MWRPRAEAAALAFVHDGAWFWSWAVPAGGGPVVFFRSTAGELQLPGVGRVAPDLSVDLLGQTCLRTNLVTKRVLDHAPGGTVIEIVSDNLSAVETIPFMLPGHGCTHLATVRDEQGWRVYARRNSETEGS